MVIINCKKCLKDNEMPSKRFKICINCNTRSKKSNKVVNTSLNTIMNIEPSNTNRFLEIYYLIEEISSYLTIYEFFPIVEKYI